MSLCERCQSKGLPIYPVRYAVAPSDRGNALPDWVNRKSLPSLSEHTHYTLRSLRAGYLYLFSVYQDSLELMASIYRIDDKGGLWQQDLSYEYQAMDYAQHLLDDSIFPTFQRYRQDEKLRDARMQKISPRNWLIYPTDKDNIACANQANLSYVMEVESNNSYDNTFTHKYRYSYTYAYDSTLKSLSIFRKISDSSSPFVSNDAFSYNFTLFKRRTSLSP